MALKEYASISLFVFVRIFGPCNAVLMPSGEEFHNENPNYGFSETFQQCIRNEGWNSVGNIFPCLNKGAVAGLLDVDGRECVEITDGVSLVRDVNDKTPRTIPEDLDSSDYRSLLEATAGLVGKRSLRWDMSVIHPGLFLKVGPTLNGAGVLEFVMDRGYSTYKDRTVGTGRMLVRQFLLPLLLGFKLKLVTLLPLLLGVLIIISKKALLLSKVAVFVTTVLGLNSLMFLQQPSHQTQSTFSDSFGGLEPQPLTYHVKEHHYPPYSAQLEELRESLNRERDRIGEAVEPKGRRNFLWEEAEKIF